MEYVNLTKIINNVTKTETKRGEQKMILESMKDEIYKKNSSSEIQTTEVTTKSTTPITARPHHTL